VSKSAISASTSGGIDIDIEKEGGVFLVFWRKDIYGGEKDEPTGENRKRPLSFRQKTASRRPKLRTAEPRKEAKQGGGRIL